MQQNEFHFEGRDGTRLFAHRWLPDGPVRGVLQVSHGMGEHAARYREPLRPLIESGIAVYANDHRGHGRTAPDSLGDFGPGGFAAVVDDMAVLSRRIRDENPGKKLVLMGHSMGSFAAQIYALEHSALINGLVLSGSAALDKLNLPGGLDAIGGAIPNARTPFDWLSRDPAEVDKYIADPLCGFTVNPASLQSMFVAAAPTIDPAAIARIAKNLPIHIFAGDQDPINGRLEWLRPLAERYRAAGIANVTETYYPGGRHEMLNETNRAQVAADLKAFVESVLA